MKCPVVVQLVQEAKKDLQVSWYHSPCIFLYIVWDLGSGLLAPVRVRVGVRGRVRVRVRIRVKITVGIWVRVKIKAWNGTNRPVKKISRPRMFQWFSAIEPVGNNYQSMEIGKESNFSFFLTIFLFLSSHYFLFSNCFNKNKDYCKEHYRQ